MAINLSHTIEAFSVYDSRIRRQLKTDISDICWEKVREQLNGGVFRDLRKRSPQALRPELEIIWAEVLTYAIEVLDVR